MNEKLKLLGKYMAQDKLSVEDSIDALDLLADVGLELADKEVYVREPDDIDEDPVMVWTEAQLRKLRESDVVAIANAMGIDASIADRKQDTINKILEAQRK